MNYYELNMAVVDRMTVSIDKQFPDGAPIDKWVYSSGRRVASVRPVPLSIYAPGTCVDYCPTAFGAIVVTRKLAELVDSVASGNIQRIPAVLENVENEWEILNIVTSIDCIDHERSRIQYYPADHEEYPAEPRSVLRLVLDPRKIAEDSHIFFPAGWKVSQIISSQLKQLLEENGVTGIEYMSVTE